MTGGGNVITQHGHQQLRGLAADILKAAGVPPEEARTVADMLIDADLMGLSSHGLQRIPQYVEDLRLGAIKPGAALPRQRW